MPTCGTIVPSKEHKSALWGAMIQKRKLYVQHSSIVPYHELRWFFMVFIPTSGVNRMNIIRRSHVSQLRSHDSRFRSRDFLFRSHKRQMRSEKATLLPGTKSFWAFSPYSNHLRKLSIIYWNRFAWRQSWHRFRLLSHQTPLANVFRSWWLASASCGSKRLFM